MSVWAYTYVMIGACVVGLALGALLFGASMPRAFGRTGRDPMTGAEQRALFGATLCAALPVLALWAVALGFVGHATLFALVPGALAIVALPAFVAPPRWLSAMRAWRGALALGVLGASATIIAARVGQDSALVRGALPCWELSGNETIDRCRAAFARDWRLPVNLVPE